MFFRPISWTSFTLFSICSKNDLVLLQNTIGFKMAPRNDQVAPEWHPNLREAIHFRDPKKTLRPSRRLKRLGSDVSLFLTDFQCLLASFLVLNSGIRPKRQTPETMQNTCRDIARKTSTKNPGKKLAQNLLEISKDFTRL